MSELFEEVVFLLGEDDESFVDFGGQFLFPVFEDLVEAGDEFVQAEALQFADFVP